MDNNTVKHTVNILKSL